MASAANSVISILQIGGFGSEGVAHPFPRQFNRVVECRIQNVANKHFVRQAETSLPSWFRYETRMKAIHRDCNLESISCNGIPDCHGHFDYTEIRTDCTSTSFEALRLLRHLSCVASRKSNWSQIGTEERRPLEISEHKE